MKKVWELFPTLTEVVRKDHEGKDCGHHPFEHALMVAQYCLSIAEDEYIGMLAAVAALIHNTDRLYPESEVEERVMELASMIRQNARYGETEVIIDAVLNHGRKNDPNDSPVLICLKDADKLANISPFDIIARSARAYPDLSLVNPRFVMEMDPESTYKNPKTVFRDAIHSTLEWETWFRLPKAKELAKKYFDALFLVKKLTRDQLTETGMDQYQP